MTTLRKVTLLTFFLATFVLTFFIANRFLAGTSAFWPGNVISYAISYAIASGVSSDTITLLLLLPLVASLIAAIRHIVGIRGFGILLPAALSVVFLSIGPLIGIILFLIIVFVSTFTRVFLRDAKVRLQYLPRMAFILWAIAVCLLGLVFLTPVIGRIDIANVSIFPVLVLVLLSEDFTRVQLGKSGKTAIKITAETLFLGFLSYLLLVTQVLRSFALAHPEILLIGVAVLDFVIGKYSGLRFLEYYRFRKLIKSK
ncbi:hypothetical protein HYS03_01935 [Candidatus Woesebacteria bacterium]|nr:hypothetical protein [Candidatus Woesebacteria bacterium]QQG47448.1 MAG: hypothetical protein HY044_04990 [Candidatus Woesebacteria bacterium]